MVVVDVVVVVLDVVVLDVVVLDVVVLNVAVLDVAVLMLVVLGTEVVSGAVSADRGFQVPVDGPVASSAWPPASRPAHAPHNAMSTSDVVTSLRTLGDAIRQENAGVAQPCGFPGCGCEASAG